MKAKSIPLGRLVEADWNANRVPASLLGKLRRSLEEFGVVENLVARPHPERAGMFEVLSGNHRLRLLRELRYEAPPGATGNPARLVRVCVSRTSAAEPGGRGGGERRPLAIRTETELETPQR